MSEPKLTEIERIDAPYRREIVLHDAAFESGMRLLRVRIREGSRFTILDIDAATAKRWGDCMTAWAARDAGSDGPSPKGDA